MVYLQNPAAALWWLMGPLRPEVLYPPFILSISETRVRLAFAVLFRFLAIATCRTGILFLDWTSTFDLLQTPRLSVFNVFGAAIFGVVNCFFALGTSVFGVKSLWPNGITWAFGFMVSPAAPVILTTGKSKHLRALFLLTGFVVSAPLSADLSDIAANAALATTSLACFVFLPRQLLSLATLHHKVEPETEDNVAQSRNTHASPVLSALGSLCFMMVHSVGLWVAYLLWRGLGDVAGAFLFGAYCVWLRRLLMVTDRKASQVLWEDIARPGHGSALEEMIACADADRGRTVYPIWGLLISTIGICVASARVDGS